MTDWYSNLPLVDAKGNSELYSRYTAEGRRAFLAGEEFETAYERYSATDTRRSLVAWGWLAEKTDRHPQGWNLRKESIA